MKFKEMAVDFTEISGSKPSPNENFEELVAQLLHREFDNVHQVDGRGGDEGIDIFVGNSIDDEISVFQCKFFLNPLKSAQKRQIISSIEKAKSKNIAAYTVCLPRNLNPTELRWFGNLANYGFPISIWDASTIADRVLKNSDIYRSYFPRGVGLYEKFSRSPHEAMLREAASATPPKAHFPEAKRILAEKRLLVIAGPPHLGKTTLARRAALDLVDRNPEHTIIDIEHAALSVASELSEAVNAVFLLHDPFNAISEHTNVWPFFERLMEHNFIIITCRNAELSLPLVQRSIEGTPFLNHVKIIPSDAYDDTEMEEIFDHYFNIATKLELAELKTEIAHSNFVEIAKARLSTPHAVSYFFGTEVRHRKPTTLGNLLDAIEGFGSVEEAISGLFRRATSAQQLFLMIVAHLNGEYEPQYVGQAFDFLVELLLPKYELSLESFEDCHGAFSDIIGLRMAHQERYRGFENEGLAFLHPSYQETIAKVSFNSPRLRAMLLACAHGLIYQGNRKNYDLVSAGFKLLNDNWWALNAWVSRSPEDWIPYYGRFDDHIQYEYFFLLTKLSEVAPDLVLTEAESFLDENIVERSRFKAVHAAFSVARFEPKKALRVLAESGDLSNTDNINDIGAYFSEVIEAQGSRAIDHLLDALDQNRELTMAIVASALRFVDMNTFEKLGVSLLENCLDLSWDVKGQFKHLWVTGRVLDDRSKPDPRISFLFDQWIGKNCPKKAGYLATLLHNQMIFLEMEEEDWLGYLMPLLGQRVDEDSQQSLLSLVFRTLDIFKSNYGRDTLMNATKNWVHHFCTHPDALHDWQVRIGLKN
jgi:DNA polymerase III delta prime subunit